MAIDHKVIQTIIAAIAVPISIIAAVFAWWQVELTQKHNRLSVRPILQVTPYLEGKDGKNGLYLSNDGLGPAIIKSFTARSGGIIAEGFGADRWHELIAQTAANPNCFKTGWPKGETAIKAGDVLPMFVVAPGEGSALCQLELVKLVGGSAIEIEIKYESMYEESSVLRADSRAASKTLDSLYRTLMGQGN